MTDARQQEDRPLRILGVFAHPDDAEFFAGGTFAKWAADGAEITFVLATSGDKGSADPDMTSEKLAEIREEETKRAAEVFAVQDVVFLRHKDGELFPTLELRRDITRMIRLKKPDIVVSLDPTRWYTGRGINHPDHRAIGAATLESVFPTARDRLNFIELERDEGLEVHKALTVYIAGAVEPNMKVDVTDHIDTQVKAILEHKSQIGEPEKMGERIRERSLDPEAPKEYPRHIERFHVINLWR
ncbi:MAG: PIG-L deacetylase family protein [Anaerolineae bacterium]|nr:PIG-L deacetylase family protein [Anaerolineae bacterium]MDQ7035743.1 PIG-L deacetylase family protein [Anaerolineae bacterium]